MKINEKEYKLTFNGLTLVLYKQEFHKDLLATISKIGDEEQDFVSVLEIIWAMAKSNKENNAPNFEDFVASITNLSSVLSKDTMDELTEVVKSCSKQTVELKKK